MIDTGTDTVIATVPALSNPTTVAHHPTRPEIWLCNGPVLEVRSTQDYSVLASITNPERYYASAGLAFLPDGSEAFGAEDCGCCGRFHRLSGAHAGGGITVLQPDILQDGKGRALCVTIDAGTGNAYLGKIGQSACASLSTSAVYEYGTSRTLALSSYPRSIAVEKAGARLWVVQDDGVALVDLATFTVVQMVNVGTAPRAIVLLDRGAK